MIVVHPRRALFMVAAAALFAAGTSRATTYRVPTEFATMQEALDLTVSGDTVLVAPGTYTSTVVRYFHGHMSEACAFIPPGVTLKSEFGPAKTRIHLPASDEEASYVVGFQSQPNRETVESVHQTCLDGFTITADTEVTSAVRAHGHNPRIHDCLFDSISAPLNYGGAIHMENASLTCTSVTFRNCHASLGGGVFLEARVSLLESVFEDCRFEYCSGSAIRWSVDVNHEHAINRLRIERCDFVGNAGLGISVYHYQWLNDESIVETVVRESTFREHPDGAISTEGRFWIEECRFIGNHSDTREVIWVSARRDEPAFYHQIARNWFRDNSGPHGCIVWVDASGYVVGNHFIECGGAAHSIGYFAPAHIEYMGDNVVAFYRNVCERSGPALLVGAEFPGTLDQSCNIAWECGEAVPETSGFMIVDPQRCEDPLDLYISESSPCIAANNANLCDDLGPFSVLCDSRGTKAIGLTTVPHGRKVTIAGAEYWTPALFMGEVGTEVLVGCDPAQLGAEGERFVWQSWSDGEPIDHVVTVEEEPYVLTTTLQRECRLTTEILGQGATEPIEAWFVEGAAASFSATANAHWVFQVWNGSGDGSYSGSENPSSVVMNDPIHEQAIFENLLYSVMVSSNGGGDVFPPTGDYPGGGPLVIYARPDDAHEFKGWIGSGPGSYTGTDSVVTIFPEGPIQQHAVFEVRQIGFEFRVSASDTDPMANSSLPTQGWRPLYLWAVCLERGLSAMEAEVATTFELTSFQGLNGVLSIGTAYQLNLAIPGCPSGSNVNALLGYWYVLDEGGTMCVVPAGETGAIEVSDCDVPSAFVWTDPYVVGFTSLGAEPCESGLNVCDPDTDDDNDPPTQAVDLKAPAATRLHLPRPNPFNRDLTIAFDLDSVSDVNVSVYDIQGRRVRRLMEGSTTAGSHSIDWDGRDSLGRRVPSGVYFVCFVAGEVSQSRKVVHLGR